MILARLAVGLLLLAALPLPTSAQEVPRAARFASLMLQEQFGHAAGISGDGLQPPPSINRTTIELIKTFEGWEPKAYDDPVGLCTIGYGHLIARKRCAEISLGSLSGILSVSQGEEILEKDTRGARQAVAELISADRTLTRDQFGALVSFTFNVGKGNFAKSTLLKRVNAGHFDLVPDEFSRWVSAKGRVLPGLVARRSCEQMLFLGKLLLDQNQNLDRTQCEALGIGPSVGQIIDVDVGEQ